jgi:hypothetical protein
MNRASDSPTGRTETMKYLAGMKVAAVDTNGEGLRLTITHNLGTIVARNATPYGPFTASLGASHRFQFPALAKAAACTAAERYELWWFSRSMWFSRSKGGR